MTLLLIAAFLLIILLEVPGMVIRQQTAELRAFWVLLAISFAFSFAVMKGWTLYDTLPLLEEMLRPIVEMLGLS
ncbi:MAG TPA: hypothetical protein VIL07_01355 [Symbiobacteriaceae bacterium]